MIKIKIKLCTKNKEECEKRKRASSDYFIFTWTSNISDQILYNNQIR